MRRIISVAGLEKLSSFTAQTIVEQAVRRIEKSGRFSLVLSGGNTPKFVFDKIVSKYHDEVIWSKIDVFWVDERCVGPSHQESNYGMAYKHLLAKVNFNRIYRMKGELPPSLAASNYDQQIRSYFGLSASELPGFDFMLLGVGIDGHVASLFSLREIKNSSSDLVAAPFVEKLGRYRITLTLPVINNCNCCLVMVPGKAKSEIVRQGWSEKSELPVGQINLAHGLELWVIDHEL